MILLIVKIFQLTKQKLEQQKNRYTILSNKKIGYNIIINASDSKISPQNKNGLLPGSTLSMTWDNLSHATDKLLNEGRLGRWSSIIIKVMRI